MLAVTVFSYWERGGSCCTAVRELLGCSADPFAPCRGFSGACSDLLKQFAEFPESGLDTFHCQRFLGANGVSPEIGVVAAAIAFGLKTILLWIFSLEASTAAEGRWLTWWHLPFGSREPPNWLFTASGVGPSAAHWPAGSLQRVAAASTGVFGCARDMALRAAQRASGVVTARERREAHEKTFGGAPPLGRARERGRLAASTDRQAASAAIVAAAALWQAGGCSGNGDEGEESSRNAAATVQRRGSSTVGSPVPVIRSGSLPAGLTGSPSKALGASGATRSRSTGDGASSHTDAGGDSTAERPSQRLSELSRALSEAPKHAVRRGSADGERAGGKPPKLPVSRQGSRGALGGSGGEPRSGEAAGPSPAPATAGFAPKRSSAEAERSHIPRPPRLATPPPLAGWLSNSLPGDSPGPVAQDRSPWGASRTPPRTPQRRRLDHAASAKLATAEGESQAQSGRSSRRNSYESVTASQAGGLAPAPSPISTRAGRRGSSSLGEYQGSEGGGGGSSCADGVSTLTDQSARTPEPQWNTRDTSAAPSPYEGYPLELSPPSPGYPLRGSALSATPTWERGGPVLEATAGAPMLSAATDITDSDRSDSDEESVSTAPVPSVRPARITERYLV